MMATFLMVHCMYLTWSFMLNTAKIVHFQTRFGENNIYLLYGVCA